MEIATLAAWGEFLGGVAVVASLLYLASQLRQNSRLLRASTAISTAQMQESVAGYMVQDPEVARIYYEGLADRTSMSEVDRQRFDGLFSIQLQGLITRREFGIEGSESLGAGEQTENTLRWLFQQPGPQQFWRGWPGMYSSEFSDYVDGLIREGEAAG